MPIFNSTLDTRDANFQKNKAEMLEMTEVMEELLLEASQGGGDEATERLRSRGNCRYENVYLCSSTQIHRFWK